MVFGLIVDKLNQVFFFFLFSFSFFFLCNIDQVFIYYKDVKKNRLKT